MGRDGDGMVPVPPVAAPSRSSDFSSATTELWLPVERA
jgi:hypothetical protein